jgi:hypothetical protein
MTPLKLTDSEMAIVFDAARPLQVQDRDAFLQAVATQLAALPHLGDGAVHRVCAEVQRRIGAGLGTDMAEGKPLHIPLPPLAC